MSFSTLQHMGRNYWWLLVTRGILAVLFGILALIWPGRALLFLVYLFGAYALINGFTAVVGSFQERDTSSQWWLLLISGIAGIIIGLLVFFWPGITALVLFYLIGIWAIVTGVLELTAAFALPGGLGLEWPFVLGGVLSIALGIFFVMHPLPIMLSVVWLLGLFAIVYGVIQLVRAMQHRRALVA